MNYIYSDELYHHGIKGQKWGTRNYQNTDGSLTPEGYKHYGYKGPRERSNTYQARAHRVDKKDLSFRKKNKLEYYKDVEDLKADYKYALNEAKLRNRIRKQQHSIERSRDFRENSALSNDVTRAISEKKEALTAKLLARNQAELERYKSMAEAEISYIQDMSYRDMQADRRNRIAIKAGADIVASMAATPINVAIKTATGADANVSIPVPHEKVERAGITYSRIKRK